MTLKDIHSTMKKTMMMKKLGEGIIHTVSTHDVDKCRTLMGETEYKQHNPTVADGPEPFLGFIPYLKEAGTKAVTHRVITEGDLVVTHNTWTNAEVFGASEMVSFDMFRIKDGKAVEHWDNLIAMKPPNASGRTQVDGPKVVIDHHKTAENKKVVEGFVDIVLIKGEGDKVTDYISTEKYLQHNPDVADGLDGFGAAMKAMAEAGMVMVYSKCHYVVAEGNFVVAISEGKVGDEPTAFYDMFRLESGKIVEHWDIMSPIPQEGMRNDNGKF